MSRLKRLQDRGVVGGPGMVVYLVDATGIYFSGISDVAASTVNAAERIIDLLCEAEDVDVSLTSFFDVQTGVAYPWGEEECDYFQVDRVHAARRDGEVVVERWQPVAGYDTLRRADERGRPPTKPEWPGIPPEVLREFRRFINS